MTTILVYVLLHSNLEWMSILRLLLQTPIADHHNSKDKGLDREDGSKLLAQFSARNDASVIRGVNDVATNTSAEARKLECKLDALVNLVTRPSCESKPRLSVQESAASVLPMGTTLVLYYHLLYSFFLSLGSSEYWLRLKIGFVQGLLLRPEMYIRPEILYRPETRFVREIGVHDVSTDTSAEPRKLEGKLDAFVNSMIQLVANQKPTSVARVCGIRSSNDHHTSIYHSLQQSGVDEHPEAYVANTYSSPPQAERETGHLRENIAPNS
ncbi:hypothetical protein Fmac_015325 [Flemingia macrophylla]|uniref:Uncharacterized protein n=1 Tax=Flemingia macrophylla TaxID=520843 RepID=A0ABD1MEU9_9FABA